MEEDYTDYKHRTDQAAMSPPPQAPAPTMERPMPSNMMDTGSTRVAKGTTPIARTAMSDFGDVSSMSDVGTVIRNKASRLFSGGAPDQNFSFGGPDYTPELDRREQAIAATLDTPSPHRGAPSASPIPAPAASSADLTRTLEAPQTTREPRPYTYPDDMSTLNDKPLTVETREDLSPEVYDQRRGAGMGLAGANAMGVLPSGRYDYSQDQGLAQMEQAGQRRLEANRTQVRQNDARSAIHIAQEALKDPKFRSKSQNYTAEQRRANKAEQAALHQQIAQGRKALEDVDAEGLQRVRNEGALDVANTRAAGDVRSAEIKAQQDAATTATEAGQKARVTNRERFDSNNENYVRSKFRPQGEDESDSQYENALKQQQADRKLFFQDTFAPALNRVSAIEDPYSDAAQNANQRLYDMGKAMEEFAKDETGFLGMFQDEFQRYQGAGQMLQGLKAITENWHGWDKNLKFIAKDGGVSSGDWSDLPEGVSAVFDQVLRSPNGPEAAVIRDILGNQYDTFEEMIRALQKAQEK